MPNQSNENYIFYQFGINWIISITTFILVYMADFLRMYINSKQRHGHSVNTLGIPPIEILYFMGTIEFIFNSFTLSLILTFLLVHSLRLRVNTERYYELIQEQAEETTKTKLKYTYYTIVTIFLVPNLISISAVLFADETLRRALGFGYGILLGIDRPSQLINVYKPVIYAVYYYVQYSILRRLSIL